MRFAGIFALAFIYLIIFMPSCRMYHETEKVSYQVKEEDADLKEGKRMTMLVCGPCHYDASTKKYTGGRMHDVPAFVGKVVASNITRHSEMGIGEYSDPELAYLIRTGLAKDGKLMPYMQRPNMADKDLKNIIAYLRSDDEPVKASDVNPGKTRYKLPGKIGISQSGPLPWKNENIERPPAVNLKATGKYLVDNLSCYDCHSKSFMAIDKLEPEKSKGYMGGGNKLKDRSGKTVVSPNLTPHVTGIADWKEEDLARALRKGQNKDKEIISFPMPMYSELTDKEVGAIYAYLMSLPPIKNETKQAE